MLPLSNAILTPSPPSLFPCYDTEGGLRGGELWGGLAIISQEVGQGRVDQPFMCAKGDTLTPDSVETFAALTGAHEALIQEILAVSAEEAQQQPAGPPPASKKVVASLPVETVDESRLAELGGKDVECSVCRCVPTRP